MQGLSPPTFKEGPSRANICSYVYIDVYGCRVIDFESTTTVTVACLKAMCHCSVEQSRRIPFGAYSDGDVYLWSDYKKGATGILNSCRLLLTSALHTLSIPFTARSKYYFYPETMQKQMKRAENEKRSGRTMSYELDRVAS